MGLSDILSCVPSWLIYLLLFVGALYLYGIWPYLNNTIKLPGPKPMAFLGNLKDLSKKESGVEMPPRHGSVQQGVGLPSELFRPRTLHGTKGTWMGRRPFIHIADPDMCRQILVKDFANFTNRPVAVPLSRYQKLFVSIIEDDHWKFIRSIISPAFSSGKMRGMVPLIQNCLKRLNERLSTNQKKGDSFNIQPVMEAVSLEVIGATAFGMDIDTDSADGKVFLEKAKKFFARNVFSSLPLIISQFFPMLIPVFEAVGWTVDIPESRDYFINVLTQAIKQRKNDLSGHKDLLTLMVTNNVDSLKETAEDADVDTDSLRIDSLRRDQKMTEDEVMAQSIIFLLAGFKTTSSAMSFLAYNLTVFTECQDKLVKEIDENLKGEVPTYQNVMNLPYLDMCLSETQRLYPAITGLFRMARNSTIINGQYIPGGANIKLLGYCLQRDPEYWPQPEKFDPERFSPEEKAKRNPYVYFPFGLGPRNCVGMRLAQLEAKMVMASILQKFRFVRTPETQVPLKYKATDHIESENGIWLKLEARDH